MHRYVGHVVSAIQKSDLYTVLGRERPIARDEVSPFGVLFARRASNCSPLPTLPGAASAVLASPPGAGCFFRFFIKSILCYDPSHLFVFIPDTYQSDVCHVKN